jgi:hypothetical protein
MSVRNHTNAVAQPFRADERALKDRAHLLVRKGKLEAAADVYLQLISQNNKCPALRLHHAELCDKLNRKDRAVASYLVAAHLLVTTGHTARSRAALNAGLRISPQDPGLRRALRELSPPPPTLSLVPKPVSYLELDVLGGDEAITEPHVVAIEEWSEVALSDSGIGQSPRTVSQRAPTRPRAR